MTTADKLMGLMEGANLNAPWRICPPTEYPWDFEDPYRGEDTQTVVAGGYGILSIPVRLSDKNPANLRLAVASVNLLPALAAAVEALVDFVDGECHCDESKGICVQCKAQAALSALDAAVAREVG